MQLLPLVKQLLAKEEGEEEGGDEENVATLARRVYPLIKRLMVIDMERLSQL